MFGLERTARGRSAGIVRCVNNPTLACLKIRRRLLILLIGSEDRGLGIAAYEAKGIYGQAGLSGPVVRRKNGGSDEHG